MDDNKLRFGVGVLVIAAVGVAVILTFLFGAFPTVLKREYGLLVKFPSAEGVSTNTGVFRDGVRIGRVSSINLIKDGGVELALSMDENVPLTHRYIPRIGQGSLVTGDSIVEFVRAENEKLVSKLSNNLDLIDQPYTDGESISYGEKASDPMTMFTELEDDVVSTMLKIREAGDAITQAGKSVDQLVTDVRQVVGGTDTSIRDVTREAAATLQEFQGAITDVRKIIGNPVIRENLEASMAKLPGILDEAQATLAATQQTFESFERAGNQFENVGEAAEQTVMAVQRTVENVEQFTQPLGERGGELVEQVLVSLANLDNALVQIDTFGKAINNSDGTIRRLLDDDELYWQIRRTVENVEEASARIRPILDDVRVFTDKVARDPRELGVRGAIAPRPTGAGFK